MLGWLEAKSRMVQSSPAYGCILYALIHCDEKGEIAHNGYSSEAAYPEEKSRGMDASGCLTVEWRKPIIIA
jgi:hypothetical protein